MKLGLVSDLHLEHWHPRNPLDQIEDDCCDVLVVAGDLIQTSFFDDKDLISALKQLRKKARDVVYVPGNHEFYESFMMDSYLRLYGAAKEAGITFLCGDKGEAFVQHEHFIGGMHWYDFDAPECRRELAFWSDSCIRDLKKHGPIFRREEFDVLTRANADTIVISHFLPTYQSVPTRFQGSGQNVFFVSQGAEARMRVHRPKLWLHGHTHDACSYYIGRTGVHCNPLGYPAERKLEDYKPLFLEIE